MQKQKELIQKRAEKLQEECHAALEIIKGNNSTIDYQDAVNVWMYTKLAELELQVEYLKNKQKNSVVRGT